ncbi:MAG: IclR family transcriptional regulator [Sulfitobacter sp.]
MPSPPSRTLARGLNVLEYIVLSPNASRLTDIATEFDLDMASAHRIVRTLEDLGYVARTKVGRKLGPGPTLRKFTDAFGYIDAVLEKLAPTVKQLSEDTGHVAHLGVVENARVVLTEVYLTKRARVSVQQAVGDVEDIYCSAIGKALIAGLPITEQSEIVARQPFIKHTAQTLLDADALHQDLKRIREEALAFDDREGSEDVACIAAPILDPTGHPIAAIGISTVTSLEAPSIREQKTLIQLVSQAAVFAGRLITQTTD